MKFNVYYRVLGPDGFYELPDAGNPAEAESLAAMLAHLATVPLYCKDRKIDAFGVRVEMAVDARTAAGDLHHAGNTCVGGRTCCSHCDWSKPYVSDEMAEAALAAHLKEAHNLTVRFRVRHSDGRIVDIPE